MIKAQWASMNQKGEIFWDGVETRLLGKGIMIDWGRVIGRVALGAVLHPIRFYLVQSDQQVDRSC